MDLDDAPPDAWEIAARGLALRAMLARAAACLGAEGIPVCALKGVVLATLEGDAARAPRPMLDVDVLVPADRRADAERALADRGWAVRARTETATTLRDPEDGLDLDLHARLVEPGLFAIDERAFLHRARPVPALGHGVLAPSPLDMYAHLVAHLVRNRSNRADARRLEDLALVARAYPLDALATARHLEQLGLGRAARYALGLADDRGDAFAAAVLTALTADPRGARLAAIVTRWLEVQAYASPWAAPAPYLLDRSLSHGLVGFARHVARGARARASRMRERPGEGRR